LMITISGNGNESVSSSQKERLTAQRTMGSNQHSKTFPLRMLIVSANASGGSEVTNTPRDGIRGQRGKLFG
jgi:hypothetical protein